MRLLQLVSKSMCERLPLNERATRCPLEISQVMQTWHLLILPFKEEFIHVSSRQVSSTMVPVAMQAWVQTLVSLEEFLELPLAPEDAHASSKYRARL